MKSLVLAFVVTARLILSYNFESHEFPRVALLFATSFAVFSNMGYIKNVLKGKYDKWGSSLAHIGFSLTIFGAVISTAQSTHVSKNQIGDISSLNQELDNETDLLLMQGDTVLMNEYFVTYRQNRQEGIHMLYDMDYFEILPTKYEKGDVVAFDGMVFEARKVTLHQLRLQRISSLSGISFHSLMNAKQEKLRTGAWYSTKALHSFSKDSA